MSDKPSEPSTDAPPLTKATRAHKDVDTEQDEHKRREFMHAMLADLRALDRMLREGRFETGPRRIGAEQEMFLIDRQWGPARGSLQMLDRLRDPHFTTELGLFQLEANADPQLFTGDGLSRMENQLDGLVASGNTVVVVEHDLRVIAGSDWVIDVGPGAGDEGGRVVATGVPEEVARARGSRTAPYLARFRG